MLKSLQSKTSFFFFFFWKISEKTRITSLARCLVLHLQALNPAWRVLCPLHRWVNHKFFTCVLWTYEFKTCKIGFFGSPPNIILSHDYLGNDFKNSSQLFSPLLSGGSWGREGVQNCFCKIQRIMPIHNSFSTVPKSEKLWKSEVFFF